jgi:hypothetical protein
LKLSSSRSEAPFARLRKQRLASPGWSVPLRRAGGRLAGRLHLYSALNLDAARAVRADRRDVAGQLARSAEEVESSEATLVVREILTALVASLPAESVNARRDDAVGQSLRYFAAAKCRAECEPVDAERVISTWLARAGTWNELFSSSELDKALVKLTRLTMQARRDVLGVEAATLTFLAVVRRLDDVMAELEGAGGETWVVARRDLEREGLADVGRAVAAFREELPHGPILWIYSSATTVGKDRRHAGRTFDPFDADAEALGYTIEEADVPWMERLLAGDPKVVPASPILIRHDSASSRT